MIISIQGKTQSKGKAASCARTGFKAFSLSMMAIKAMNSVTASPGHHSAYVKNDGDLWTTGKNSDGQLGLFHSSDVDTPTIVSVGNFSVSLGGHKASLGGGGGKDSLAPFISEWPKSPSATDTPSMSASKTEPITLFQADATMPANWVSGISPPKRGSLTCPFPNQ